MTIFVPLCHCILAAEIQPQHVVHHIPPLQPLRYTLPLCELANAGTNRYAGALHRANTEALAAASIITGGAEWVMVLCVVVLAPLEVEEDSSSQYHPLSIISRLVIARFPPFIISCKPRQLIKSASPTFHKIEVKDGDAPTDITRQGRAPHLSYEGKGPAANGEVSECPIADNWSGR